jgi:hypothetical protein
MLLTTISIIAGSLIKQRVRVITLKRVIKNFGSELTNIDENGTFRCRFT